MNPDFAVLDDRRATVAFVEAKSMRGTSADWAAKLRRNILSHLPQRAPGFFVIVTPDTVYLWAGGVAGSEDAVPPTAILSARLVLQSTLAGASVGLDDIYGEAFELLVAGWLARLVRGDVETESIPDDLRSFVAALRDGRLQQYDSAA